MASTLSPTTGPGKVSLVVSLVLSSGSNDFHLAQRKSCGPRGSPCTHVPMCTHAGPHKQHTCHSLMPAVTHVPCACTHRPSHEQCTPTDACKHAHPAHMDACVNDTCACAHRVPCTLARHSPMSGPSLRLFPLPRSCLVHSLDSCLKCRPLEVLPSHTAVDSGVPAPDPAAPPAHIVCGRTST